MELVRACAELGVTPSASLREAKRAYRKLVKRWHPDRFANDPQGPGGGDAAAAADHRGLPGDRARAGARGGGRVGAGREGGPRYEPGERLPREEVERLVRSLGNEGPLDAFLKQPMWWWPLPFGIVFLLSTRSTAYEWLFAGGVLLIALAPVIWWLERRRPSG